MVEVLGTTGSLRAPNESESFFYCGCISIVVMESILPLPPGWCCRVRESTGEIEYVDGNGRVTLEHPTSLTVDDTHGFSRSGIELYIKTGDAN